MRNLERRLGGIKVRAGSSLNVIIQVGILAKLASTVGAIPGESVDGLSRSVF